MAKKLTTAKVTRASVERTPEENAALAQEVVHGKVLPIMTTAVIDQIKSLAKPYKELSETQQSMLIESITARIHAQLIVAIKLIAAADNPIFGSSLDTFTKKGGELAIKLKAPSCDAALLALARGGTVNLVFVDQTILDDGSATGPKPEPDEPELPVEQAQATPPADPPAGDVDLAGEDSNDG